MRLIHSNIVLLGGFNPHIIEPTWLSRHGVVAEKSDEFMTEIQFGPRASQTMRFNLDGLAWEVTLERVLVGSDKVSSPAQWLIRLLDLLPHTPVRAVGINFKLQCDRAEWPIELPALPGQQAADSLIGEIKTSTAVTRAQLHDGTQVNLTLHATQSTVTLDANFHRGLGNSDAMLPIDMAKKAMLEFEGDWSRLREIVTKMTGKEVG